MAVGKGFLDQYSVFCVFGSVVGCVVVPLITQVCRLLFVFIRRISIYVLHLIENYCDLKLKYLHYLKRHLCCVFYSRSKVLFSQRS